MNKSLLILALLLTACGEVKIPAASPAPESVIEPELEVIIAEPEIITPPARVEKLTGLSPSQVIALMGSPSLVRRDGLGQVMLFEHEACVFDIVFYAETIETPYKVVHISARTRQGQQSDKQLCLTALKPDGFDK